MRPKVKLVTKSVRVTCPQAAQLARISQKTGLTESDIIRTLMQRNIDDVIQFIHQPA